MNTYDIETFQDIGNKVTPYCVCMIINEEQKSFYYNNDDVVLNSINYIFENYNSTILYIHNINFDGLLIIESISKQKTIKIDALIRDLNIYFIELSYGKKTIMFKCSYKILPESLDRISKIFKIGKKMIFPYIFSKKNNLNYIGKTPNKKYFKNKEEWSLFKRENNNKFDFKKYSIEYCMNDVMVTCDFLIKFKKLLNNFDIDIDSYYSAPSISINIFEKKFNDKNVKFFMNKKNESVIRNSYFGGRCEVYGNPYEKEFIHYYDFSGMYAQCMMEKFPFGELNILRHGKKLDINRVGFHLIEYDSNMEIPVLPHRSIYDGKLMFVNGKNRGIFWFEEIKLFLEMGGRVNNVLASYEFEEYDYIFNDFVNYFTEIRKKDDIHKTFGKLIINSLYGRLGMGDIEKESMIIENKDYEKYTKELNILSFKEINNLMLINYELNEKEKKNNLKKNIALASAITSKARIKLYRAQQDVINNNGRILYSDTDSIFAAYKKDVTNEVHGLINWNKENIKIKDAVFITAKTYAIKLENNEEIIKIKGFNSKEFNFNTLKKNFYDECVELSFKDNKFLEKKNLELYYKLSEKKLNLNNYSKRIFINNKKETRAVIKKEFEYI